MHEVTACRSCGAAPLLPILELGEMPLADGLVRPEDLEREEARFPLDVAVCPACSLVQILVTVPPERLFGRDYPYYSSFSDELLRHSRENALRLIEERNLGAHSLVAEIASNDGYLLRNFVERGIPVLGIDPAPGPAEAARRLGIRTRCAFFGRELAESLRREGKRADVIVANNVLAHVADLNGFVAGLSRLMAEEGVASIEVPYVADLVRQCEFDTIYHEHLCYFSVTALAGLFARHGLVVQEVERLPIHGGTLRIEVGHRGAPGRSVTELLRSEIDGGLTDPTYYRDFASRVDRVRAELAALLRSLKSEGARIAAYGAAAKGTTLLNSCGIGRETIDFVVDRNVHKQGLLMPGVRIPIAHPERLLDEAPDYVLLLAWNFREEILRQQAEYRRRGGRFIVPIPAPTVIPASIGTDSGEPCPR